ncbi:BnaA08g31510D [Brassica napus]|uniref:Transmembrane 9 superfamily member n=1 Tax=Brassica napus TaxID=3708 RepID=A0A078ISM5_BRANA|nr:BnaA08g31510D [Brassica napus]
MTKLLLLLGALILSSVGYVRSDASDHRYKEGDIVPLYANKVGPFHNPSETYRYFDLPFCVPEGVKEKKEALGEVLNGDRLVSAPYKLNFREEKDSEVYCKKKLSKEEVRKFRQAVEKDYYFQMYYDDLPIWGFIGKVDKEIKSDPSEYKYFLYKHIEFEILYNNDRVIEISARMDPHSLCFITLLKPFLHYHSQTIFIFMLALVGVFYPYNRGALFTALVVIYALTSGIAGYTSASFYCQLEGKSWVRNLLLTGCLFCGPLLLTFCFLNTVAITYTATAALPFGTIVVIVLIWTLVTSPLLVLGGIAGKNSKAEFQAPCRTTKYPREIPPLPWYRSAVPQMAMAGFLPFSAIYIELYYIFASVWGHRIYTIYSILFIVFIILIIVTAFITVALTYFQLAAEDHQWWWRSFLCGGSTGLFIYAYCLYYYYARSDMSGFMQTSFFFGYMACICYGFFLMLGTVGFRAALFFVRHIYRSIKCE